MHKISLACAAIGLSLPAIAQTECDNAQPLGASIQTQVPFSANFYVGAPATPSATFTGFCLYVDVDLSASVTFTGFGAWLYDQGNGNPPVPDQTGLTANVNVYTCATSYQGNEQEMAQVPPITPGGAGSAWTLAGNGSVVVEAWDGTDASASDVILAAPITLPAGQYGLCLEFNPPDPANPANVGQPNSANAGGALHTLIRSPAVQPTQADSFMTISAQGFQNDAFFGAAVSSDNINMYMDYQGAAGVGYFAEFGDGCYFRPRAIWEEQAPTVMDLANTAWTYLPGPSDNYLLFPGAGTLQPTAGLTNRLLTAPAVIPPGYPAGSWDDALDTPITLPFAWDTPGGGSTNTITIGSNGHVFLDAVIEPNAAYGYYGAVVDFQDFPARFAPAWGDLDPSVGTPGLYFETDGVSFFRITWENFEEWNVATALNTMQLTVTDFGPGAVDQVDVVYGNMAMGAAPMLIGWTPGNGAKLGNQTDISAIGPAGLAGGDGSIPPILSMDSRPVLGTTPNLVTTNITPGTIFVFSFLDFAAAPFPIPLSFAGMPGCNQYIGGAAASGSLVGVNPSLEAPRPFSIPNSASLAGVKLFSQSAPFTGGLNAAGILTSNGMCIRIGN
jgi:hypothetical protein